MLSPTPAIDRSSLHPGTGYLIAPRVPRGLAAVVEGLTREVLRHRPEDIYVFAAHHFEKLLKLREQYHAEEYSDRELSHEFNREFNLWSTKNAETRDVRKSSNGGWSLEKEIEILEGHRKVSADVEESPEDVSTDKEPRKVSKQASSKVPTATKRVSRRSKAKEMTSDARATKIISQMPGLHGPSKNIQAKDIKQELRKNKLSGEKGKTVDGADKAIRGERRSRTRISKSDKGPEEEVECPTTTAVTTTTSKTSSRRPLKKVRRIETESETETERETKARFEKGYERSNIKSENISRNAIARTGSRERRPEAQLSEHSSGRKVSSRALSMDRIRAYVLRKFASTASLEVLRSPTYVEQVQEVIDRAAPIIKEKLEEIRRPRGKRSRSVDLGWNDESFRQRMREDKKRDNGDEEEESRERRNGSEREIDSAEQEETENSLGRNGTILKKEEKKQRRRSVGSGKRSKKREGDGSADLDVADDSSKHDGKSEHESDESRDTLEARLTATQNILEGIAKSTSELGGICRIESGEPLESEATDHANVVSLPIVRPPSSKNSKSTIKNGADSLTLPPISPEAPKSAKKKDELSLPVLPANGNHSAVKSQEQDASKDVEEASTMRDITSDIEDIAILPEDDHVIPDIDQGPESEDLIPDIRTFVNEEKDERDENINELLREDTSEKHAERRESVEEFKELEELVRERGRVEEVFKDSLNVTPEIVDVPPRPDSLEPEDEVKLEDDGLDPARDNRFDGLKDKLMEIEMAEKSIEKVLAGQQIATCDGGETTSQAEKSITDAEINEAGMLADEVEETVREIRKSIDKAEISMNKEEKKDNDKENTESTSEAEKIENVVEVSNETESVSTKAEKSINLVKEMKNKTESLTKETENSSITKISEGEIKMEKSINETENLIDTVATLDETEKSMNGTEKSTSETKRTKNGMEILETEIDTVVNQTDTSTKIMEEAIEAVETKKSTDENERSINGKSPNNDIEELVVKVHVGDAQSVNVKLQDKDDQITEAVISETQNDSDATESKSKAEVTNESSEIIVPENVVAKAETSRKNSLDEGSVGETRKKREADKSPTTSPLSAEIPFAYILSEGSPCEIPDSVTTVIIPDRPYLSPVTLEDESHPLGPINKKEDLIIRSDVAKEDEKQGKGRNEYEMEAFGEYIPPETTSLPVDIDFVRGAKGAKLGQDVVIVHQDLDKIKEEGEEEEEEKKERIEKGEINISEEKDDDKQKVVQGEETIKLSGMLENIVEHEENEESDAETNTELKGAKQIVSVDVHTYESLPDTTEVIDTGMTDNGRADVVMEPRSTLETSSEESGSTQDNHTTTSSDVKESTASNQSGEIESSSLGRPVVPELNLDSLQDNTVSSFKMTANGTTKEDNGSPRESDTMTSLIEPLTSDERLMNRPSLVDNEEEVPVEQLTEDLSIDLRSAPEADQLYQAEHAEYEWLEKDPLSSETILDDEAKSQEDSIGLLTLPDDIVQIGPLLQEKEEEEKLSSEEEIARELIGSLNEEMELRAKELDSKEESKDSGESVRSNLAVDDKASQVLSVPSTSVDELKQKERKSSSEEFKELNNEIEKSKTEVVDKVSHITDISQIDKNKEDTETEKSKLVEEREETTQVAPLAQFEQDELLEPSSRPGTANKKITVESKPNTIDTDFSDNQEKHENKKTSVEEVLQKGKESIDEAEDSSKKQEENEQGKIPEECKQEKLKMQEENGGNLQLQEEMVDTKTMASEITESKKDSINETKNDKKHDENDQTNQDKSISEKEVKNEKETVEEKTKDLSAEGESFEESIPSAISEQSMKDHPHGYWTAETKSSTVETVIETVSPNTSTDKEVKAAAESEIIEDESHSTKKDDFYWAVVKIQACIRGFLARRRMQKDICPKPVSDSVPSAQKTATASTIPQDTPNLRETRRLRREEALRNTTLSLENAFAIGRLQHTSEFHDSVPLPLFDVTNGEVNSILLKESTSKEEDVEQDKQSDAAKPDTNETDSVLSHSHDNEHARNFQKSFTNHSAFPIVMHLMTDTSRNGHFRINQSYDPDFNPSVGETKPVQQAMDILMLGYPRDDDNRYLNFITSVEDLGNMDSLPLDDAVKTSKSTEDAYPSMISSEGSIREPLALPGTPQSIVIEEVTSLDGTVPSGINETVNHAEDLAGQK
ncbi:hypothetical protein DMN91_002724 [Ooceraea biroi]|uniref:RIIa domain-containing protein n=1 Tax=Ooceraea biroi TaxID=2015173 RepID=A0A3L8DX26_OOCBI|nr:hypothetical protein DMN91_002724 [Ooceraea biroi]